MGFPRSRRLRDELLHDEIGIVRIATMSSTGNTAYVFQGKIVPTVPAPVPAAGFLAATLAGLVLPWLRRRRQPRS
jgi:MYXO-CTERM domain-containing protein